MKNYLIMICFFGFLSAYPVHADDSVASIKAGSVVLEKIAGIAMTDEVLSISKENIHVRLEFENQTRADITTLVAFPVPDIRIYSESDNAIDISSANPMGFNVKVNGTDVPFQLEKKNIGENEGATIYSLKYYWQQTFPAGKKIVIEHEYRPARGAVSSHAEPSQDEIKNYCIEPGLQQTIKTLLKNSGMKPGQNFVSWSWIDYTLVTGANWKGPIGKFKLILGKGSPENFISTCFTGFKKVSPVQFESVKSNFEPKEDLHVLFLTVEKM